MSGRDGERRRGLTRDERDLWNVFTKKIEPLRARRFVPDGDSEPAPKAKPAAVPKQRTAEHVEAPRMAPPPLEPLGRRMKQRVVRGREAIGERLDLHGMTQGEAHAALLHFLRKASARQQKLVLVVTGKGGRGGVERDRGVLRRQVPHWLALPEFRAFVIGFEEAHVAHGGEGALYIRVRRARS
ncbi:MAG TPA: Smr/MutS family protein [Pseudolabrys sp.]|nr:Smr/MutS family protein [Pseudolabrys sp.]